MIDFYLGPIEKTTLFADRCKSQMLAAATCENIFCEDLIDLFGTNHKVLAEDGTCPTKVIMGSSRLHIAPSKESLGLAILEAALQVGGRVGLVRHPATALLEVGDLVEGLDNPLLLQLTKADNRAGLVMLREGGVTTYLVDVAGPLVKSFMYQAMQAGLLAPGTTFIFSTLDFPSLELDFARLSGARLLGFSLMDQETRCCRHSHFKILPKEMRPFKLLDR